MAVKFLTDYPVCFISDIKALVVADIQIGLEHELYQQGITIQPQAEKFSKILLRLVKLTGAKKLVILGDLKHKVPGISFREMRELPKFWQPLLKKVKVIFCRGNHDTGLEGLIPNEIEVHGSKGTHIGRYGFFHGHAWPSEEIMECDHLFMGHLQPGIEFRDKFGHRLIEQVWVRSKLNKNVVKKKYKIKKTGELNLIIAPAFNPLLGCAILNTLLPEEFLDPLMTGKTLDLEESKVYLLDGTYLGKLKYFKS